MWNSIPITDTSTNLCMSLRKHKWVNMTCRVTGPCELGVLDVLGELGVLGVLGAWWWSVLGTSSLEDVFACFQVGQVDTQL